MLRLLDTSTISYLVDAESPFHDICTERAADEAVFPTLAVSVLTVFELASLAAARQDFMPVIEGVTAAFARVPIDEAAAGLFASLKRRLAEADGTLPARLGRHNTDLILAALAIHRDAIIVSNDSIFARLAALDDRVKIEDWTRP